MKTIQRSCLVCKKEFTTRPTDIRRGQGKYCSIACSNAARKKTPEPNVECAFCDAVFYLNTSKRKNSRSGLFFCCREHKDLAQRIGGIEAIQPDHYKGSNGHNYRVRAFRQLPNKCNRCGYKEHSILVVHHVDRNRSNNELENLEILCPNCHAIEHGCKQATRIRT